MRFMHGGTQIIYLELIIVINIVREERKRQRERQMSAICYLH